MCTRFACSFDADGLRNKIEQQCGCTVVEFRNEASFVRNYNVSPGEQAVLIVEASLSSKKLILDVLTFGFNSGNRFIINKRCPLSGTCSLHE
jgi:putative SOS response-associated peptidase YedK